MIYQVCATNIDQDRDLFLSFNATVVVAQYGMVCVVAGSREASLWPVSLSTYLSTVSTQ